jgi:hypothetical protein
MRHTRGVPSGLEETRRVSSAAFGAEKFVEIVLAFAAERPGAVPLKDLAERTGVPRNLLNPVLARLVEMGALRQLPRIGGSRGAVHYDVADDGVWAGVLELARLLDRSAVAAVKRGS